jgi:hypothetical protein
MKTNPSWCTDTAGPIEKHYNPGSEDPGYNSRARLRLDFVARPGLTGTGISTFAIHRELKKAD